MSRNVDSAGEPTTPTSTGHKEALDNQLDDRYVKAVVKGDIKVIGLNSDNYQSWADGMQLLLDTKMLWPIMSGDE